MGILNFDKNLLMTIGFQLLNTAILSGILAYLLYDPVRNFLAKRAERIKNQIDTAAKNASEAEALKKQYEQKINEIEKERALILEDARKRGMERQDQLIKEAKEEATAIKNRALLEVSREKAKAKDEMKTQIIEISSLMASRYIKTNIDDTAQNKLLEEVIEDLGDVEWLS